MQLGVLMHAALPFLPDPACAQQATEAWVQGYNGPGNPVDSPNSVTVDAGGTVYVTGASYGGDFSLATEWVTIAYASAGMPLWTNHYNTPNGVSTATRVAVDAGGNVFVTGSTWEPSGMRCVTIKCSNAGAPMWTNFYAEYNRLGTGLVFDADGNVCVMAAASYGRGCALIKYSGAGAQLWARTFDCTPRAMGVDKSGNVYLTGDVDLPGVATLKYSSAGVLLWTTYYGTGNNNTGIFALALDSSGNVVVTGRSALSNDDITALMIKYSTAGTALWTNRGPVGAAVVVDSGGNAYVTGSSEGVGSDFSDFMTIRYSGAGVPLWTNRYRGPGSSFDEARALTLDAGGNVIVTGSSAGDFATVAYSSSGSPLWTIRYNGPANKSDSPSALAVDTNGNVYVTGSSEAVDGGTGAQSSDFTTVKYVIPPFITRQPFDQTNTVGTSGSFSLEVAGGLPLSYQWRRQGTNLVDGGNISGVTTANLLLADVQPPDAVGYSVMVTNAYGSVTSAVAQLTVTIPSSPGRFSSLSYAPETGLSFIFRDATLGQPYRIQRSSTLAERSWEDWRTFTYTEPMGFIDVGAAGSERRFYRAVTP